MSFEVSRRLWCVLAIVSTLATTGCSLSQFEHDECTANADCRGAFGFGAVCNSEGLCESTKEHRRCRQTYPEDIFDDPEKYADALVMGTLMDRSVAKKVARQRSIRLAAVQLNEELGTDDRPVGLVMCTIEENPAFDNLSGEEAAVASAEYLTEELGLPVIVGPSGSGNTSAVFAAVRDTETLVISPSATSTALTSLDPVDVSDDRPGLLWRTAPPDSYQGQAIAKDAIARSIGKVAVIYQTDAYGEGLSNVFNVEFSAGGGHVEMLPWSTEIERGQAIVSAGLTNAEEVLFVSSEAQHIVSFLVTSVNTSGYENKTIFLPDAGASADMYQDGKLLSVASSLFPRIRGTRVKPLGGESAYENFAGMYANAYSGDNVRDYSYTAQSYDAAWLAFYGAAWAEHQGGGLTGSAIARGLRKVSCLSDGETAPCNSSPFNIVPSSWRGIAEQFRTGTAVEIRGTSGDLDFDLVTEETAAAIEVWALSTSGAIYAAP